MPKKVINHRIAFPGNFAAWMVDSFRLITLSRSSATAERPSFAATATVHRISSESASSSKCAALAAAFPEGSAPLPSNYSTADIFSNRSIIPVPTTFSQIQVPFSTAQEQDKLERFLKSTVADRQSLDGIFTKCFWKRSSWTQRKNRVKHLLAPTGLSDIACTNTWYAYWINIAVLNQAYQCALQYQQVWTIFSPEFALAIGLCKLESTEHNLPLTLPEPLTNEVSHMIDCTPDNRPCMKIARVVFSFVRHSSRSGKGRGIHPSRQPKGVSTSECKV